MLTVGVDTGKTGAYGEWDHLARTMAVRPIPTVEGDYDVPAMVEVARRWKLENAIVALEVAPGMPGEGAWAGYWRGASFYVWRGILDALNVPWQKVTPQAWRKHFGLAVAVEKPVTKASKEAAYKKRKQLSLALAREKFGLPFRGPKGGDRDGEAEAALIALYAQEKYDG